jgi:PPOX class probable F420-dependent enzyme
VTLAADGRPRPVPIAYAFEDTQDGLVLYSALDEKRKTVADPRALARVRDIGSHPGVAVLVDHWAEDWAHLAWVRLEGTATLLEPTDTADAEHAHAVGLLRARYPQYATQALETRPVIRIDVERVSGWSATEERG